MGQQLDRGSEPFGPAVLAGIGLGRHSGAVAEAEIPAPVQKKLSLPRHLTRPLDVIDFAHPTEQDLARVFSYYRVSWIYEPTTFHLEVDEAGRPTEQVCPDFYLPDHDLYIELTTMRQALVTRKNRKIRRLKEAFPSLHIKLLYRKDYDRLMGSVFGSNGHAVTPYPGKPIVSERQLEQRIRVLASDIAADQQSERREPPCWGRMTSNDSQPNTLQQSRFSEAFDPWEAEHDRESELCLIGLGNDSIPFLTNLEFELKLTGLMPPVDMMTLSQPGPCPEGEKVCIARKPSVAVEGRDVVLVSGIISTGLNVAFAADWLLRQGASSVRVCTLFDRAEARILDVPICWSGFQAPHEIIVGFGISYLNQYHDLPVIAPLKAPARPKNRAVRSEQLHEHP